MYISQTARGWARGVRVLPVTCAEEIKDALDHIRNGGNGIIEEYICQDSVLSELNPSAVSVVRFYSVTSPYGTHLFAPVLTSALHKDIANGCQDALTAVVDIRTGKVLTDAVDQNKMEEHTVHPMTGVAFKGLQLNHWDKTLEMLKRAVPLGKKISNIGWDVAITKDGPVLIEAIPFRDLIPLSMRDMDGSQMVMDISRCLMRSMTFRL